MDLQLTKQFHGEDDETREQGQHRWEEKGQGPDPESWGKQPPGPGQSLEFVKTSLLFFNF